MVVVFFQMRRERFDPVSSGLLYLFLLLPPNTARVLELIESTCMHITQASMQAILLDDMHPLSILLCISALSDSQELFQAHRK